MTMSSSSSSSLSLSLKDHRHFEEREREWRIGSEKQESATREAQTYVTETLENRGNFTVLPPTL